MGKKNPFPKGKSRAAEIKVREEARKKRTRKR